MLAKAMGNRGKITKAPGFTGVDDTLVEGGTTETQPSNTAGISSNPTSSKPASPCLTLSRPALAGFMVIS